MGFFSEHFFLLFNGSDTQFEEVFLLILFLDKRLFISTEHNSADDFIDFIF